MAEIEFGVRLTVVPSESEADAICGLLRVNGIRCSHREAGAALPLYSNWWHEVLVPNDQVEEARELLATPPPSDIP